MRRIIIATAAVFALVAAGAAYAQSTPTLNTYTGSLTFKSSGAGTPAKPVPASWVELFHTQNVNTALDAAPVTDIKLKMYGLKIDWKAFPTCTLAQVTASLGAKCPAKSLVASGPITALLGPTNLQGITTGQGANTIVCTPLLDIWNAGGGKVVELPVVTTAHPCGGLETGSAAPYVVTFSQQGNYLLQDAPLPPDVSTDAGGLGLYNSLTTNDLNWSKMTAKVKGKSVAYFSSIGCLKGKRPYTMTFTATNGTTQETESLSGNGTC